MGDKKINQLASSFEIQELQNSLATMMLIEDSKNIELLREAIKLKTESIIFVFSGTDEMSEDGYGGVPEGVAIYEKIGDKLNNKHLYLIDEDEALKLLQDKNVKTIYTGDAKDSFLNFGEFNYIAEPEKNEEGEYIGVAYEITRGILQKYYINYFKENGIDVIILNNLV